MPRRRNSKASRAIRAALCIKKTDSTAIDPERLAADIQLGEEILRAVQAQRRLIPQHLLPPLGVLVQQAEAIARNTQLARIIPSEQEPVDDVLQIALAENEKVD
ncbi:hypothetical protein GHT06_006827 [Daphnia sinensis]|uniref:Uncharacterized protein n=1 Tax=Daphnia sinensis TaxID=1820382 RepID=A0AAD5KT50_9CRUS|nr:hypothetical protein GHT06_007551 [Daphnia sinensis]KAI9549251.1 hypothetical protein GHT06_006827 [Daphnia sinensis]